MQVELLPLTSVTVNTAAFAPTFAQLNVFGRTVKEARPQASVEPLLIIAPVTVAFPEASNCTVTS